MDGRKDRGTDGGVWGGGTVGKREGSPSDFYAV